MLVKNIACGMMASETVDVEEQIDIDLITERNMFYFSGMVVWKNRLINDCFDYGLQLTHYDIATRHLFQEYLTKQKTNYANMISKAR